MNRQIFLAVAFCFLFIGTHFANKYVLSILKFTYPTIFQGWQTLVGVVLFRVLLSTGHVEGLLHGREWHECALWLPGMMCFVISIYSGSRALASLPIPVFFVMQNIVLVFKATGELVFHKQATSLYTYSMLMLSLASALAMAKTDPQFEPEGYAWMCVHIFSVGIFEVYTNLIKGRLKLKATERLYCCYVYSVFVLAPCSYFLGDALEAVRFPYLYFVQFYVGCILSGVFGMLMKLCAIRLQEKAASSSLLEFPTIQITAKVFCSFASVFFYDMQTSHAFLFFVAVNCLSSFGFCESSTYRSHEKVILSPSESEVSLAENIEGLQGEENYSNGGVDVSHYLKRHDMQQEMIRVELSE